MLAIEDAEDNPIAGEAKKAYQEAEAEHDPDKPAEDKMFSALFAFNLLRTINNLKKESGISEGAKEELRAQELKCSSELDRAFRHRIAIELPASCHTTK